MDEQIQEKKASTNLQDRFIAWAIRRAEGGNSDLGLTDSGKAVRRPMTEVEAQTQTPETRKVTELAGLPPRSEPNTQNPPTSISKQDLMTEGVPKKTTLNYERFIL